MDYLNSTASQQAAKLDTAKSFRRSAFILQALVYFPIEFYFLITRSKISKHPLTIDPANKYVLVANHDSKFDPYALTSALRIDGFKLLPFRYIAANSYLYKWYYRIVMIPFGAFPAKEHPKYTHGIEASKSIIQTNQTLVIFPEGRITKNRENEAKPGVAILACEGVRLIPVYIKKRRFGYKIVIGSDFDGAGLSAEAILDKVYALNSDKM